MKTKKNVRQITPLTTDSQKRLLAYTTAAGVGAFFAGQGAEGQVVQSSVLVNGNSMTYPLALGVPNGQGPNQDYFYLNIDGGGNEFNFVPNTWRVTFGGTPAATSFALNPTSSRYIIPWTVGQYVGPIGNSLTRANQNQHTRTFWPTAVMALQRTCSTISPLAKVPKQWDFSLPAQPTVWFILATWMFRSTALLAFTATSVRRSRAFITTRRPTPALRSAKFLSLHHWHCWPLE